MFDRLLRMASTRVLALVVGVAVSGLAVFALPASAQQAQNRAPVAQSDSATTPEDTAVTIAVLANDSDPDGNPLTVASMTAPAHGTAVINAGTTITYTPALNFNGTDSFTYTISDGVGGTATATVTVTVTPVNDAPTAVNDAVSTLPGAARTISVLANDSDVDGDTLTVTAATTPAHGTVVINGGLTVTYTPAAGFTGTDSFGYTISDGHGLTATATVAITVTASNIAPVAVSDSVSTTSGVAITISVLANDSDIDGDTLTVTTVTAPAHGTAVINGGLTVTYTPTAGYTGTDSFDYTISDGRGGTATASVTITIASATTGPGTGTGKHGDDDEDDDDEDDDDAHEMRDACRDGGWEVLGFRNQGLCIAFHDRLSADDHGAPWPMLADWRERGHGPHGGHSHHDD